MNKIRNKYIISNIIKDYLAQKIYLNLARYNKRLQKKLDVSIKDYKNFFNTIIIELTPKLFLTKGKNYFINIEENKEPFFHIYFDNNKFEEKRTYITSEDKVKKIKIIIDNKIKSFKNLFHWCNCIQGINILKCEGNNIQNMYSTFENCSSLINLNVSKLKLVMSQL